MNAHCAQEAGSGAASSLAACLVTIQLLSHTNLGPVPTKGAAAVSTQPHNAAPYPSPGPNLALAARGGAAGAAQQQRWAQHPLAAALLLQPLCTPGLLAAICACVQEFS